MTTVVPPKPGTSLEAKTVVPLILSLSKDPPSKANRPSPAADNLARERPGQDRKAFPLILSLSKDPPSKAPPRPSPAADNLDVTANRRSPEPGTSYPFLTPNF